MIGGNIEAILQQKSGSNINEIGERVQSWTDVQKLWGWLDLASEANGAKYAYDAKLRESTHVFICDHTTVDRFVDDKRLMVNGLIYDVLLIDDPMELHQQLEIYLKYVGR